MTIWRLCSAPGCPRLVARPARKCDRHAGAVTATSIRSDSRDRVAREIRSSAEWKRARRARLAVDGARCTFRDDRTGRRCQATGSKRNPLDVHHVDPLSVSIENAYEIERLRTLCRRHHRIVEARDRAQATA